MSDSQTCARTTDRTIKNVRKPDIHENNRQDGRECQKARHAWEQQTGRERMSESQTCSRTTDRTREKVRKPDMLENNRQDERKGQKARHAREPQTWRFSTQVERQRSNSSARMRSPCYSSSQYRTPSIAVQITPSPAPLHQLCRAGRWSGPVR